MKSFDEKLYICETCHKHIYKKEIPCQAVYNKVTSDPIPDQLKCLTKIKKVPISNRILQGKCLKVNILKSAEEFAIYS